MKSFFFTIKQTLNAFKRPHMGARKSVKKEEDTTITKAEALTRIALTFVLVFVVLYLFRYDNPENSYSSIASTIMGAIVGYWFR